MTAEMSASMSLAVVAHELLCMALFYTVFARLVKVNCDVKLDVRFVFFLLGGAALFGMVAPFAYGFAPTSFSLVLLTAVVLVQFVTGRHWMRHVPECFMNGTAK